MENTTNNALIFIPDISGFSRFTHDTDIISGKYVIMELLTTIIESNSLHLKISEIEGDAVLFYRFGKAPDTSSILSQFEKILISFRLKLHEINLRLRTKTDLSLKLIVHYGPIMEYRVDHFKKLYGEAIVESHFLLKNTIESTSYVLFTEQALEACDADRHAVVLPDWVAKKELCIKGENRQERHLSYYRYDIDLLRKNVLLRMENGPAR